MNISSKIIWSNRSGDQISWFHPRACVTDNPGHIFMTLQRIGGSDFYGPLHQSVSFDGGHSWSNPEPVPGCQGNRSATEYTKEYATSSRNTMPRPERYWPSDIMSITRTARFSILSEIGVQTPAHS